MCKWGWISGKMGYGQACMMLRCHGWGWKPSLTASHIHIGWIKSVLAPWDAVDGHIGCFIIAAIRVQVGVNFRGNVVWLSPSSLYHVVVSLLRLKTPIDCIKHPYWINKRVLALWDALDGHIGAPLHGEFSNKKMFLKCFSCHYNVVGMVCRMNSHLRKNTKNVSLCLKCVFNLFSASFSNFISEKKMPHLLLFSQGLFVYVFSIPVPICIKKNTHIPLFGYAQKNPILLPGLVSWSVSLYVCLLVGLLLVIWLVLFCIFFS